MAYDKVIDSAQLDANLTAVADAIRTKGGTSEALSFPEGFVSAVEGIQAGGGGQWTTDGILSKTEPNGNVVANTATSVPDAFFQNNTAITSFESESISSLGEKAFENCTSLVSVNLRTSVPNYCFRGCSNLKTAIMPLSSSIGTEGFKNCTSLERISMPKCGNLYNYSLQNCSMLKSVDIEGRQPESSKFGDLRVSAFLGCTNLKVLVLRGWVTSCKDSTMFDGTPFGSGGSGGIVFCRSIYVERYKTETNWSILYEAGTCHFLPVEEYTIDGTIYGEMDWDKVEEALANLGVST